MIEKMIRQHAVSRRSLLAGTAGALGGAVLARTAAHAQTNPSAAAAVPGSAPPAARYGDPAWWAQRKEEILEPALEIVDPHHHLWDRDGHRYLLDQLLADTDSGHNIVADRVCRMRLDVSRRRAGGDEAGRRDRIRQRHRGDERERPLRQEPAVRRHRRARRSAPRRRRRARAGGADRAPATAASAASATRSPGTRARRFSRGRTNSPKGQMADATWRAGFARLAPLNLTFEAWLYHPQLDRTGRAGARLPADDDHPEPCRRAARDRRLRRTRTRRPLRSGRRHRRTRQVPERRRQARRARHAVRHVRLPCAGETPPSSEELAAAWKPYIETCIEAFGPDRGMFESNFPPDGVSSSYAVLWNAFKRLAADYSADEKAKLFSGTAKRVYRLA